MTTPIAEIIETGMKLSEKATARPWQVRFIYRTLQAGRETPGLSTNTPEKQDWPDSEYIVHAVTHFPALCAEIRRLESENAGFQQTLDRYRTIVGPALAEAGIV
jgi:hypothetical protein